MKNKKISGNTTHILLGIIAAEVVFLTVHAIADRRPASGKSLRPAEQKPWQKAFGQSPLSEALRHVTGLLRRLFFGAKADIAQGAQQVRERVRVESRRPKVGEGGYSGNQKSGSPPADRDRNHADTEDDEDEGIQLKGNMQGIALKLKDPAWAGVLAVNDGDISRTDAERAVPMPQSAHFVERLDKNPFIGKGMQGHSRKSS